MGYIVKVKNENDGMEVETSVGHKLVALWQEYHKNKKDGNIPIVIEQYGWHGLISDIRNIKFINDAVSKKPNTDFIDYVREHEQIRKQTPLYKSNRIGFAKLLHYSLTGKKLEDEPAEFLQKVIAQQLEFFSDSKNKNRIHPEPIIFKGLYQNHNDLDKTAFDALSRVVSRDVAQQAFCA